MQRNTLIDKIKANRITATKVEPLVHDLLKGDTLALSRAITLLESTLPDDKNLAQEIIHRCMPYAGNSVRIGITGVPGVGKSTFIEAFGESIIEQGNKVAVLAIDPSSQVSKGSILGDKTRMENLSNRKEAFVRPSPSSGTLGGVAKASRETILLCEAAGFNVIILETVGVGQSETTVASMVDFFLLLMLSGAGDELQGIKRGIMEMADAVVINKADGPNEQQAKIARQQYANALHFFPAKESAWTPKVLTCSALHRIRIEDVWNAVESFKNQTLINGWFHQNRVSQAKFWFHEAVQNGLTELFFADSNSKNAFNVAQKLVEEGKSNPFEAAKQLIDSLKNNH